MTTHHFPHYGKGLTLIDPTIVSHPLHLLGKRSDPKQAHILIQSHPYMAHRVEPVCGHSSAYLIYNNVTKLAFCGICFLRDGFQAELPGKIHVSRELAENGNPATTPKFISHLFVSTGLVAPGPDEDLKMFREKRKPSRARGQYTMPALSEPHWQLFPVASSLWKLMGFQPPLARVLVRSVVRGQAEVQISNEMRISLYDVSVRMVKAIRTTVGYLPDATSRGRDSARANDGEDQGKDRSGE